jgi:lambda repressor-like predicted transcriptional regulator
MVEASIMNDVKTVANWMTERGRSLVQLIEASGLEKRVVKAMIEGRYTASPEQRQRIAAALGVRPEQIACGHIAQVEHIHGHGPQFGRSP